MARLSTALVYMLTKLLSVLANRPPSVPFAFRSTTNAALFLILERVLHKRRDVRK